MGEVHGHTWSVCGVGVAVRGRMSGGKTEFKKDIGFNATMEYGVRKCKVCGDMKRALHVVSWVNNGGYPASSFPVCIPCAKTMVQQFYEQIDTAERGEDAYMLGEKI